MTFALAARRIAVVSTPLVPAELTPAETAVAGYLAQGLADAEIARRRGTSARTVANQVRAITRKLGVRNRRQVARALLGGD